MPWILQGNPERFDMRAYIHQQRIYWLVNRYASEFQRGDQVLFWESGANGGIVAYGVVVELPVARNQVLYPADLGDAFWQGDKPKDEAVVVGVRVLASVANGFFVSKTAMKQNLALAGLDILRMPQATVYRCTAEHLVAVVESPPERHTVPLRGM
jgi:hypothetical protein